MNKVITTALIAGGLLLINSPEAAAHKEVRLTHQAPSYHHYYRGVEVRRAGHMPRWLHRNDAFRRWYRHTPLKRNYRIGWGRLFEIYRWERRYDRHYRDYDEYHRHSRRHDRDRYREDRRRRH